MYECMYISYLLVYKTSSMPLSSDANRNTVNAQPHTKYEDYV